MSELANRKRLRRAIDSAERKLLAKGFETVRAQFTLENKSLKPFDLIGFKKKIIKAVSIRLDRVEKEDWEFMRSFRFPSVCRKEIWVKRKGQKGFHKLKVN